MARVSQHAAAAQACVPLAGVRAQGLYVDPGVVAASGLLLLLLLMVSFQRILGLDKWVAEWFL